MIHENKAHSVTSDSEMNERNKPSFALLVREPVIPSHPLQNPRKLPTTTYTILANLPHDEENKKQMKEM
jgi:hypothetical protein